MMRKIVRNGTLALLTCAAAFPAIAADEAEIAAARQFWLIRSALHGYQTPEGENLDQASKNLVTYCAQTPASQMPRSRLETCEEFDGYKRILERERWRKLEGR